jgi:CDP-2,3-bis-(O-geranylgeranyl)-sn-glycerol synthase
MAVWLMLPANIANMSPQIGMKFNTSKTPIDRGKQLKGKRILGDGKTFEGFLYAVIGGLIIAFVQLAFADNLNLPAFSTIAIFTLPTGAMLGDIAGSFLKRRLNIARGHSLPLIDQLDFVIGAWFITLIFDYNWFITFFTWPVLITILIITPLFHLIFNIIGYKLGICKEPW